MPATQAKAWTSNLRIKAAAWIRLEGPGRSSFKRLQRKGYGLGIERKASTATGIRILNVFCPASESLAEFTSLLMRRAGQSRSAEKCTEETAVAASNNHGPEEDSPSDAQDQFRDTTGTHRLCSTSRLAPHGAVHCAIRRCSMRNHSLDEAIW